jgi:hypothetical protein
MVGVCGFGMNFDATWKFRRSTLGDGAFLACIAYIAYSLLLRL